MQVKLLVSRVTAKEAQSPTDIVEVTPDEAQRMVEAGQAEIVRATPTEKAVRRRKPEKATK